MFRCSHLSFFLFSLCFSLQAEVDFAHDVRPILNANCTACHGGVKEAGEISFIYRDQALGKGKSGKTVIVPGDPDASEMIVRITTTDQDDVMPKPEHGPALSKAQIDTLRQWIQEGAKWGEHWSFVAPEKSLRPAVKKTDWPRQPIDHFILARLEAEKLQPSAETSPALWLRRASLDLTGLPPSVEELDAFQKNAAIDLSAAMAKETDRLLASPHFGERWASVWLDLARYADSEGFATDRRRDVWKFRDWVIDAFNRDLPYDQFTIDQLAGDQIPNATLDQKIATTFQRLSQSNDEGGTDDEEFRVAAVIDRISTTWEVWQGLTFGCVQCHSHPYEPIKHEEFYQFMEFFNQAVDADLSENLPKLTVPLDHAQYAEANALQNQIRQAEQELHDFRLAFDSQTTWHSTQGMTATAEKAKLSIVKVNGVEEYQSDANVAAGALYQFTFPTDLTTITALRVEFLPLDEKKASHTPEWGAELKKIALEIVDETGKTTPVALQEVIADEAHPLFDPNGSILGKDKGWGTYSKSFGPRHATIVLAHPLTMPAQTKLRVSMRNGGMLLASFPMASKRGRISYTDQSVWIMSRADAKVIELQKLLVDCRAKLNAIPSTTIPVMEERDPAFPRGTHVFMRGNWLDKGEKISVASTPKIFPPLHAANAAHTTRLDLAKWIAAPTNPLTSRVAVNRFWLELFGTGIVPTPEDFGSSGEKPTHPELLDTLAVRFSTDMKWSVKTLLKEMVTSATYRQSSLTTPELEERDRGNRLLARGPRQRLTAEMTRDHSLAVSGLLSTQFGGPPAFPPIPDGVWKPFNGEPWKTAAPGMPERYRRAIYTYMKRSVPYPLFATFDAPSREVASKRRLVSNTPLQALAILNDPAFQEAAAGLAKRMSTSNPTSVDEQISFGYRAVTSCAITADRLAELRSLYRQLIEDYTADPASMKGLADTADQAALAIVASVILNLDEAMTR